MRLGLAFRAFFGVLGNAATADRVSVALVGKSLPAASPAPTAEPQKPAAVERPAAKPVVPVRSEAVSLLALLQRESRLVDFLQEPIGDYTNEQIGAAVRDVHRDAASALERVFAIRPVLNEPEGSRVEVDGKADRFRLVGSVSGSGPFRGSLVHGGWQATRCELPTWTGADSAALVIAPAELEVR